jgi:hypothetical protein
MKRTCGYRIYPAWFGGAVFSPMVELARGTAERMGQCVVGYDYVGYGTDHRGEYMDFDVTYSSSTDHLVQQKGT